MNKKGQFFLMAAVIAIVAFVSISSIVNYARTSEERETFDDLAEQIDFEANYVLDYGVYSDSDTEQLVREFIANYSLYVQQDSVFFIFGNADNLQGFYLAEDSVGSVGIVVGSNPIALPIEEINSYVQDVTVEGDEIVVTANNLEYRFTLRPGQNFYFVITHEVGDERYVHAE